MTRENLKDYILSTYNATSDYPWLRYPSYEVFRHQANKKWFALLADVPDSVFGPPLAPGTANSVSHPAKRKKKQAETQMITILNIKCDSMLASSLRSNTGIHAAYHMNKDKWISIEIATVPEETIKLLLDMSFDATAPKIKSPRPYPDNLYFELFDKYPPSFEPSDPDLADFLIKLIRHPHQDIAWKYYMEGETDDQIANEFNESPARIKRQRSNALGMIRARWYQAGEPISFMEYVRIIEQYPAIEDSIYVLNLSHRVNDVLIVHGIKTVEDFLALDWSRPPPFTQEEWNEIFEKQKEIQQDPPGVGNLYCPPDNYPFPTNMFADAISLTGVGFVIEGLVLHPIEAELGDYLIGKLPKHEQAVLNLRYHEGLSEAKIKAKMCCHPSSAAIEYLHSGLKHIREIWIEHGRPTQMPI